MSTLPSPERWRRVEAVLDAALELPPAEREAYLDRECGDDPELRREVASLLAAHERSGPVDRLSEEVIAPLVARLHAPADRLEGRRVGRFEVLEMVGSGAMGAVYRARDERLGREVVLKFLPPHLGADSSAKERFAIEARAAAALEHPNVCTVLEVGETPAGQLFIAMPYYDGETLQRRIARGPLPVAEAVDVAVQIARGLAKAHARGIVHRDVKPSNVMLTADGIVKLLDFGVAKLADVTLTDGGVPVGTVAYMSPEQARGEPVDQRTDLWSLGVLLYEMLAGRRPFGGEHGEVLLDAIRRADPAPVSSARADVPPELERIVRRLLAKERKARFQSAPDLERALTDVRGSLGEGGAPGRVSPARAHGLRRPAGRRAAGIALLAAAIAGSLAAGTWWWVRAARAPARAPAHAPPAAATPATIAVLPFANMSADPGQEYFSDGITEELIHTLSRVPGLRVAARTSAFAFKNRSEDIRKVGGTLRVATVLEGSVRRSGDRLRVTAQLINVADGYHLWSETYERDAGDAFAIQQEIARAIAQTLRVKLVGAGEDAGAREEPDVGAYDLYLKGRHALYLKGRYAWYSRTEEGLRAAAKYFEEAVGQAPGYARAHAGLADAYAVLGFYDYAPPREAFPKAEAAARRALALDAALAGPHATLGYIALYFDWDLRRGEEQFRRAIALDPNYSTAHQWYANLLTAAGRFPEAVRAMRRAQEIDPLSLIASAALGWVLYHAGDYAAAADQCRQTLELNADYGLALLWRGWALQELDSLPAAVETHRRAVAVSDGGALFTASLARSLALAGERREAESLLRRLEARAASGYVPSYEVAKVHEALGRPDRAIAWLERALAQRSHSLVLLRVDPQLARLRQHPDFARLAARVDSAARAAASR